MILMIDNYDSFVYNLVQFLGELGEEIIVKRNDEITLHEVEELNPEIIVYITRAMFPSRSWYEYKNSKTFQRNKTYIRNMFRTPNYWTCIWRGYSKGKPTSTWEGSSNKAQ